MQNDKLKSYLHLHLIVFIWGFTAILGKLLTIDAVALVWYRMGIASVLIFGYIKYKRMSLHISRNQIIKYVFGGVVIALHWTTFFYAIKISNISIALATMSTGAFFTIFIEALYKKKKVDVQELIFGVLAIVGLYIIYQAEISLQLGMFVALLSSFLSAVFSVFNADFVKEESAIIISFYEIVFGVAAVTIYLLYNGELLTEGFFILQPLDYLWLFILSSICTAYAFIVSVDLLKKLSAFTVMLTINLEPIYAIFLAVILFPNNEKMSSSFYLGAGLILLTVVINGILKTTSRNKRKSVNLDNH
ncbi:MAG: EamA family transporter [Flavobacteriaceae bacterium]|nr:EamA family transporter [Flavobacteriaceae bacterium]